jgi:hypothetical protein
MTAQRGIGTPSTRIRAVSASKPSAAARLATPARPALRRRRRTPRDRLRREHHRLLGNGYCTRPTQLDCAFESICETCTYFQTTIEFRPAIQAQHDHAATHDQPGRQQLFARLLTQIDDTQAS